MNPYQATSKRRSLPHTAAPPCRRRASARRCTT